MFLCAELLSASNIICTNRIQKTQSARTKTISSSQDQETQTALEFTKSIAYPMSLGLGIGIGIGITSVSVAYLYKNSLQEWLTQISTKAIYNNAHKFPIHVNIPQEDVPVWIKWIVASIPTLLNQRNNPEPTQV